MTLGRVPQYRPSIFFLPFSTEYYVNLRLLETRSPRTY